MARVNKKTQVIPVMVTALILMVGQALLVNTAAAQGGRGDRGDRGERGDRGDQGERRDHGDNRNGRSSDEGDRSRRDHGSNREHFGDNHRTYAREYYSQQYRNGRCPPGLARRDNGCLPPGQVRQWNVGRALPRNVVYYDVPPALVVQFGQPPRGYRYVRVASDILLIALGTGMVVDAIQDLGSR